MTEKSSPAEIAADIDRLVGDGTSRDLAIGGAYDAANQFDRSIALWQPALLSADAEILPEKGTLDARVRDMRRNDGYVQTGNQLHRDHIVGSMYLLNSQPNLRVLGLDETWGEEFQQEVEAKFMLAGVSDNHWFDAAGINDFTAMIRLAVGVYAMGGEVLATAEWLREQPRPFKTAIQFVDTDRLSTPWGKEYAIDEKVRGGVHINHYGRPLGYYIRDAHPSDVAWRPEKTMNWTYVKARKPWGRPQVMHILEQQRVAQSRGIAEIVAGLRRRGLPSGSATSRFSRRPWPRCIRPASNPTSRRKPSFSRWARATCHPVRRRPRMRQTIWARSRSMRGARGT